MATASDNLGVHEYFFLLRNMAWFCGQHKFIAFCMLFIKCVIDCSSPYGVFILRYLKSSNSTNTFFLYSSLSTLSQSILSLGILSQVAGFFFGQAYNVVVTGKWSEVFCGSSRTFTRWIIFGTQVSSFSSPKYSLFEMMFVPDDRYVVLDNSQVLSNPYQYRSS